MFSGPSGLWAIKKYDYGYASGRTVAAQTLVI